jgi:anti-sigma B factor antagonist
MKAIENICPVQEIPNMVMRVDERRPSVFVIGLEGCFDCSNSPQVRKAISLVFTREVNRIIVDLSGVDYIDSSGLATLIEAQLGSEKSHIRFTLMGLGPSLEAVFDLANVRGMFEIIDRGPLSKLDGMKTH